MSKAETTANKADWMMLDPLKRERRSRKRSLNYGCHTLGSLLPTILYRLNGRGQLIYVEFRKRKSSSAVVWTIRPTVELGLWPGGHLESGLRVSREPTSEIRRVLCVTVAEIHF